MGGAKSYQIWIPYFRFCRVSDDTVEITPPILFGCGFVFDRIGQKVSISRRFLGIHGSHIEIPFSDISCHLHNKEHSYDMDYWDDYDIEISVPHDRPFKIAKRLGHERARRVFEAIWTVIRRTAIHKEVLKSPGISHTELLRRFAGDRITKEAAVLELLDKGELKCEHRGSVRRYYAKKVTGTVK